MVKCPKCGAEYNDNTWFCIKCGSMIDQEKDKIKDDEVETKSPEHDSEEVRTASEETTNKKSKAATETLGQDDLTDGVASTKEPSEDNGAPNKTLKEEADASVQEPSEEPKVQKEEPQDETEALEQEAENKVSDQESGESSGVEQIALNDDPGKDAEPEAEGHDYLMSETQDSEGETHNMPEQPQQTGKFEPELPPAPEKPKKKVVTDFTDFTGGESHGDNLEKSVDDKKETNSENEFEEASGTESSEEVNERPEKSEIEAAEEKTYEKEGYTSKDTSEALSDPAYAADDPYKKYEPKPEPNNIGDSQQATSDSGSIGWGILGFFFPIVGLILFLVWRDDKPNNAKTAGMGALISVVVNIVLMFLSMLVMGVGLGVMSASDEVLASTGEAIQGIVEGIIY